MAQSRACYPNASSAGDPFNSLSDSTDSFPRYSRYVKLLVRFKFQKITINGNKIKIVKI
jgi:hypothetical protein